MQAPLEAYGLERDGLGTQDLSLCKNRTSRHGMDNSSAHSAFILGKSSNAALDSNELELRQWAIPEELATFCQLAKTAGRALIGSSQ